MATTTKAAPVQTIQSAIPGLSNMTKTATGNIDDLLSGNISPSLARNANAYWGAGAGMGAGGAGTFIGNRGFDLYNTQTNAAKQQGLGDLLSLIGGYSGTVAETPGQAIQGGQFQQAQKQQAQQFGQAQGQQSQQFNQQHALQQFQQLFGDVQATGGAGLPIKSLTPNMDYTKTLQDLQNAITGNAPQTVQASGANSLPLNIESINGKTFDLNTQQGGRDWVNFMNSGI